MTARNDAPLVTLTVGELRGSRTAGIDRFLGIPYAAAPLGEARLRLPEPVSWSGVRDATRFGPTAPQAPYSGGLEKLLPTVEIAGDEWLNLNVWTPAERAEALPVIVWIHGGSFAHGSNALPDYDGTSFARDGVVFVSINYRVGSEGFSVLEGAPLNLGIADQLAALRWVQREIASFGGDPRRVTVMGESAGGNSVAALLAHPDADSLFRGAIMQSAPLTARTPKKAGKITRLIAKHLRIPATREAFAAREPAELVAAERTVTAGTTPITGGAGFQLAIGDSVPVNPEEALGSGAGDSIPVLIGTNTEEHRLWLMPTGLIDRIGRAQLVAARLVFRIRSRTIRAYRANRPGISTGELFGVLATDLLLRLPMNRLADARLSRGASTFVYEFAWRSPVYELGAAHAMELGFVFDGLDRPGWRASTGPDAPQSLADEMHAAWVRFAHTGDPGWPAWNSQRPVRVFDTSTATVLAPREDERASWE